MSTKRKTLTSTPQQRKKTQRTGPIGHDNSDDDENQMVSLSSGGATRSGIAYNTLQPFGADGRKLSREEEVEWLGQLNRRLEIVLLTRHSQERATITQIADKITDEKSLKFELETVAKAYSAVLAQQQAQIQTLANSKNVDEEKLSSLQKEHGALQTQLKQLKNDRRDGERELQEFKIKYQNVIDQADEDQNRIEQLEEELDEALDENQKLVDELTNSNNSYDSDDDDDNDNDNGKKKSKGKKSNNKKKNKEEQVALEAQIKLLHNQLEIERQHYQLDGARNKDRMKEMAAEKKDLIASMELEFKNRLEEALNDHDEQHQLELSELATTLNTQAESQQRRLTEQVNQLKNLNQQLAQTKLVLDEELGQVKNELREADSYVTALESQTNDLKDELADSTAQHSHDLTIYQDHIGELNDLYYAKELEFEQLMQVKVSLALEIAQYRQLIETEENRLLNNNNNTTIPQTPVRRSSRRKAPDVVEEEDEDGMKASSAPNKVMRKSTILKKNDDKMSTIVQTGLGLDGKYIKFTNGSTKVINLNGYSIGSDKNSDLMYTFDNTKLQPNQQVTVFFHKTAKKDLDMASKNNNLVIDLHEDEIFDQEDKSDKRGILVDGLGREVLQFEFINKGRATTTATTTKASKSAGRK